MEPAQNKRYTNFINLSEIPKTVKETTQKMKKMSRILALMLVLLMITGMFFGCAKEGADDNSNGVTDKQTHPNRGA